MAKVERKNLDLAILEMNFFSYANCLYQHSENGETDGLMLESSVIYLFDFYKQYVESLNSIFSAGKELPEWQAKSVPEGMWKLLFQTYQQTKSMDLLLLITDPYVLMPRNYDVLVEKLSKEELDELVKLHRENSSRSQSFESDFFEKGLEEALQAKMNDF